MKKVILILSIVALAGFSSCKKKVWGCMDETALNYSPVATENAQDCIYQEEEEVVVSTVVNNISWEQWGNTWGITVNWSSITQDVLDNGAVSAYMRASGTNEWMPLPFSMFSGYTNVTTSFYAAYYLGAIDIVAEDDDGVLPDAIGNVDIKLVIFK